MARLSKPPSRHVRNGIEATKPGHCPYCGWPIVYVRRPGWWWQRLYWWLLGVGGAWGCSHCFRGVPIWRQKQLMNEREHRVRQRVRRIADRYPQSPESVPQERRHGLPPPPYEEELDA